MSIFRRTDGYSNVVSDDPGGAIPFPIDPKKWMIWIEDFIQYDVTQAEGYWNLDVVNAGGDTLVGPTGVVVLTLTGASDSVGLQLKNAPIQLTANKKAIFKSRVKIKKGGGTIGEQGFVVGLTSFETTTSFMDAPAPTARAFADGWCFLSYDSETNIDCMQGENNAFSIESSAASYADDTWMNLDIYWDGSKSTFYKDNVALVEITTNPPTSVISPVVFISAGQAQTDAIYCDYLMIAVER